MKRLALVSGLGRKVSYNQMLVKRYEDMGYQVTEFKFNPIYLMSHHLRNKLDKTATEIITNYDIIHSQSGGFVPVFPHYVNNQCKQPWIMETPAFTVTTGTFMSGIGIKKSFHGVKDIKIIQKFLDYFCFQIQWKENIYKDVLKLKEKKQLLLLGSHEDGVSDNRGHEHLFHHIYQKGKHVRLFLENDFKVVEDFLKDYQYTK